VGSRRVLASFWARFVAPPLALPISTASAAAAEPER